MKNSKTKAEFEVSIKNKELSWAECGKRIANFILEAPEGRYIMLLRKKRAIRTTGKDYEMSNQNGYYWGVVIPRIKEYFDSLARQENNHQMIMSPNEIHNGIKMLFLADGMYSGFPKVKSTSDLDKYEWEQLMQKIRDHFLECYHLNIPEPNFDR
jgi:hypothetical protein